MDLFLLAVLTVLCCLVVSISSSRKLPPGPWGLPFIGHLHLLRGKPPHKAFHSIANRFGPIVRMRLGMMKTVIVSSPDIAREVFTTHDANFSSRPYYVVGDYLEYGFVSLGASPYGEHYRGLRKLCTMELFSTRCIDSFAWVRKKELANLMEVLLSCHGKNVPVNLLDSLMVFTFNAATQMFCSKKYFSHENNDHDEDAVEFKELLSKVVELVGKPCLSNFVPWYLRWLDWQIPEYKRLQAKEDKYLQKIVDEHKCTKREYKDFVDMLLDHFGEGTQAETYTKATLLDMIAGGTDTSAVTSERILAAVMLNPRIMKKLQDELDKAVGPSRMVRESDLPKLEYLQAVVKETLRLYSKSLFLLPRKSTCDATIGGYHIPKGTTLIVNVWALSIDATAWENPNEFIPERFMGRSVDYKGQDFELIPFGSGRRKCPGMALGVRTVEFLVANLLHGFDWNFEAEVPPSMEEIRDEHTKTPWRVIVIPRLPMQAYTCLD